MGWSFRCARRWIIALLAAMLLSGAAVTLASPLATGLIGGDGSGFDPLSPAEQARALESLRRSGVQAETLQWPAGAAQVASAGVPAAPSEVVLLVERYQEDKQVYAQSRWPRRADVYVYRYTDNTLIRQVYNLETQQVDRVEVAQGVQLPLIAPETQRALAIAFNDQSLRPQLDAAFQAITQQPLVAIDQLSVKAMTFHADAAPGVDLGAAAQCGQHRCAQLLLAAGDNVALPIIPVVDLSTGIVVKTLAFDGGHAH